MADKCSLEAEPRAQLNLTRASGKVRSKRLRSGVAEAGCVGQKIVGLSKLHAVEEIVEFKADVEFHALMNSDLLTQDHLEVVDARCE